MKSIYKYMLGAIAGVSMVGCNNLDTEPMAGFVTSTQKEEVLAQKPEMLSASVQGITSMSYLYLNITGDRHNDFGYPSIMLFLDSRGADLVSQDIGYNWFSDAVTYTNCNRPSGELTTYIWETMYNQIYSANSVIKVIDKESTDDLTKYYLAQALAFRGHCYTVLAQMYAQTYVGHETNACVPIITDENMDEAAANGIARNTVSEVYNQIITDLSTAIDLLTGNSMTRPDKRYVDLATVYGLRCRANMVMNKWSDAAADAKAAMNATSSTPYTMTAVSVPTFQDCSEFSWMWGIVVDSQERVVTSGIINFPSNMGSLNYGYASVGAWRYVSQKLFNSIPDSDVRKGWFLDENVSSPNLERYESICPGCVSYAAENIGEPYVQVKFAPYQDELYASTNANDIPLMRVEEMILNYAEAVAMGGNPAEGAQLLTDFVQKYRNPSYVCNATTATGVQDAIYWQREVEFWGEGRNYFDLLRLNKGVDRRGAGFQDAYTFNIPAGDNCLIMLVPESEMQANSLIGDNNPTPSIPTPVTE